MLNGRCRLHGGLTPRGAALPQYKHGRYSKLLPKGLAESYKRLHHDPEILSAHDEITLLLTLLGDKVESLQSGCSSSEFVADLNRKWDALESARDKGDQAAMAAALSEVGQAIRQGGKREATVQEIADLVDRKTRVADRELKRQIAIESVISAEKAMVLISAIVESVRRHVDNGSILAAISADVGAILAGSNPKASGPGETVIDAGSLGSSPVVPPSANRETESLPGPD